MKYWVIDSELAVCFTTFKGVNRLDGYVTFCLQLHLFGLFLLVGRLDPPAYFLI